MAANFISDPLLFSRIKQLVSDKEDTDVIDAEAVSLSLQHVYSEYARRKRRPFVQLVERGLVRLYGNEVSVHSNRRKRKSARPANQIVTLDDQSDASDNPTYRDQNMANNSLTNLYNEKQSEVKNSPIFNRLTTSEKKKKINSTVKTPAILSQVPELDMVPERPTVSFKDIGGCESQFLEACQLAMHLKHPEIHSKLGVIPARGFLLHGPPGCGKTLFAQTVAGELDLALIRLASTELVSGVSGESEQKIRQLFSKATLNSSGNSAPVLVIGATNRPDSIDPALRRAGRFDREIALGIPDESTRRHILAVVCRDIRLDSSVRLDTLARLTPGYVGADLVALAREASMVAVNRICESVVDFNDHQGGKLATLLNWLKSSHALSDDQLDSMFVKIADFQLALLNVHPSAKREGFATVPDVSWDEIGALKEIRDQLEWSILYPIRRREEFETFGLASKPQGVLLCGPPGCGKTLLAKAVANETGMNFISVKGPELISMYVGESERAVRTVFQRARDSAPCVIFFDEIDALCPKRSESESSGSARLVNQLLTEMDGIEARKQVFLIGATNRPDIVDPAILRPGRLDKVIYVGFPTKQDQADIIRTITKNGTRPRFSSDISIDQLTEDHRLHWFTGADLAALVREASVFALKEQLDLQKNEPIELNCRICVRHFHLAMDKIRCSVREIDRNRYEKLRLQYL